MVLAKHLRVALVGASLLMSFAGQATAANFPGCVDNCISSSGCQTSDESCMCKEARSVLLDSVVSCMYFNCKSDLRNFDEAFLGPIEEVCSDVQSIPSSKLEHAEERASSWISKLPAATPTPKPEPSKEPEPEPKPTSDADADTTEESTPERTSPTGDGTQPTPSAETDPLSTTVATPPPAAQTTPASGGADDSDDAGSDTESDTDAGSDDDDTSAAWRTQASFSLLGLPLALLVTLAL